MGGHHHVRARVDGGLVGHQLVGHQFVKRAVHQRKSRVAVDIGVAVAWEVLQAGHSPRVLQTRHERAAECRHDARVVAEGPHADHRVGCVVVDVHHRREVCVEAQQGHLLAEDAPHGPGVLRFSRSRDGHVAGAAGAEAQSADVAALLVDGHQHRQPAALLVGLLHVRHQPQKLLRVAAVLAVQQYAPEPVIRDILPGVVVQRADVFRRGVGVSVLLPLPGAEEHHLRQLVPQGHARDDLIN